MFRSTLHIRKTNRALLHPPPTHWHITFSALCSCQENTTFNNLTISVAHLLLQSQIKQLHSSYTLNLGEIKACSAVPCKMEEFHSRIAKMYFRVGRNVPLRDLH